MKNIIKISFVFLIAILFSCGNNNTTTTVKTDSVKYQKLTTPDFNADSAYLYVKNQVDFGPRVPGTAQHDSCAKYFAKFFKNLKAEVIVQETKVKVFDGKYVPCKNIIAQYSPEKISRVALFSHWDSRPYADHDPDEKNHKKPILGANDGGSSTGVLMEIARQLSISQPHVGIDIILFDVEDYGQPEWYTQKQVEDSWCLGSQYWAKNPHKTGYFAQYGILLDMVGGKDAVFTREGTSMYYAPNVVDKVWNTGIRIGYSSYFSFDRTNNLIDDHLYVNKLINIPSIDIIHHDATSATRFHKAWHTVGDDMSVIDKNTLKAVGQTVLEVIFNEIPLQ